MASFPIRTFGDPVLRSVAMAVDEIDDGVVRLVTDMTETMYAAPGVGLAAPQIGVSRRVIVFDVQDDLGPRVIINPELIETTGEWVYDEGCLSVPGHYWPISRPFYAAVQGLDLDGNDVQHAGDDLLGRVLQHEVDHLNGKLLIARLTRRTRKAALKTLREEALGPVP